MTAFTTEKIDVEPWFDMELFMGVSQETRLGGDVMDRFMTLWKNWLPHLTVKGIDTGKIKYLWSSRRERGAGCGQGVGRFAVQRVLVQRAGADHVHGRRTRRDPRSAGRRLRARPKTHRHAARSAGAEGIPYSNDKDPILSRRYAVVTHYPSKAAVRSACFRATVPRGRARWKPRPWSFPATSTLSRCDVDVMKLGEGKGNFSPESFPFPSPPPLSLQRLSTGGEAAWRAFV